MNVNCHHAVADSQWGDMGSFCSLFRHKAAPHAGRTLVQHILNTSFGTLTSLCRRLTEPGNAAAIFILRPNQSLNVVGLLVVITCSRSAHEHANQRGERHYYLSLEQVF
uniref:Uncharacterized protein n=1 Tax=Gasterosteus aculeatus TaxID=69293 RepID=G3NQB5_GASAC